MTDGGSPVSPLSDDLRRFWRNYLVASSMINHRLSTLLEDRHGVTLSDLGVLSQLYVEPNHRARMAVLADALRFTRSRTTQIVDRLERSHLVTRDRSDSDGRGVYATLTDKGASLVEKAAPDHTEAAEHLFFRHFTDTEIIRLGHVFGTIIDGLDNHFGPSPGAVSPS